MRKQSGDIEGDVISHVDIRKKEIAYGAILMHVAKSDPNTIYSTGP